jgi:hypothetical protein
VLFVFTCPVITYYQAGYIPSSTAFSTILIAYYFYFKSIRQDSLANFKISVVLFSLAALTRTPFNIFIFAILLQKLYGYVKKRKVVIKEMTIFLVAYGFILLYNLYRLYLTNQYGSQFLTTLLPPDNLDDFTNIWMMVRERWTYQFLTIYHYILLSGAVVMIIIWFFRKNTFSVFPLFHQLLLQAGLIIAGAVIYFILMAKQFVDHEYYFMDSIYPGLVLLFVTGISLLKIKTRMLYFITLILSGSLVLGSIPHSRTI